LRGSDELGMKGAGLREQACWTRYSEMVSGDSVSGASSSLITAMALGVWTPSSEEMPARQHR
jgi:hypothetical protein